MGVAKRKFTGDEPYDEGLFQALRTVRKKLADEQGVPPFVIFSDATLAAMAVARPTTLDAMAQISGVGQHKLGRYGSLFVEAIREYGGMEG